MEIKTIGFLSVFKMMMKNGAWIIAFLLGVQAFFLKLPQYVVLGLMLICIGLLFFPLTKYGLNKINVCLSVLQKIFIGVFSFVIASFVIGIRNHGYYTCLLYFGLIVLLWLITILYSKHHQGKKRKQSL